MGIYIIFLFNGIRLVLFGEYFIHVAVFQNKPFFPFLSQLYPLIALAATLIFRKSEAGRLMSQEEM